MYAIRSYYEFQGTETNPGNGPVPNTQVVAMASPNRPEHDGWVYHPQREIVQSKSAPHPFGKGYYGFPALQVSYNFV